MELVHVVDREALARRVVEGIECIAPKLAALAEDIRQLWREFEVLKPGETIMGCTTKKEFCRMVGRTPRAVRYMLAGGNANRAETISPPSDDIKIRWKEDCLAWIERQRNPVIRALASEQLRLTEYRLMHEGDKSWDSFENLRQIIKLDAKLERELLREICHEEGHSTQGDGYGCYILRRCAHCGEPIQCTVCGDPIDCGCRKHEEGKALNL
jgi:hypothetical protein